MPCHRIHHLRLGRLLMLVAAATIPAAACQGPEAFYRNELHAGAGGFEEPPPGTGGTPMGTGGAPTGTGGMAMGTGGMLRGTGGMAMGTGGIRGTGGTAMGTGGMRGTGGMTLPGTGGAMDAGTDGKMDAGTDGTTGTTPCAGLCAASTMIKTFTVMAGTTYNVSSVGTTAEACYETKSAVTHANCNNLSGRTLSVNGGSGHTDTGANPNCSNFVLPATRNGGFCFQFSAGMPDYAAFSVYY